MDQPVGEDTIIKAFRVFGQTLLCTVSGIEDATNPGLDYTLYSDKSVSGDLGKAFAERLGSFLSLDVDLSGFYALADKDAQFKPVVQALYGYHPIRFQSPFEAAVWAILSQRNRMVTARNMYRSLVHSFGHAAEWDGVTSWRSRNPRSWPVVMKGTWPSWRETCAAGSF